MLLSTRIALYLAAVIGIYAVATDQIQKRIFYERFLEVEKSEADEDMLRIVEALEKKVDELDRINESWSAWNDSYAFVSDPQGQRAFVASNLTPPSLRNEGIDLLYFCDLEGNVVWSTITNPDRPDGPRLKLREFPTGRLSTSHPFLANRVDQLTHVSRNSSRDDSDDHDPYRGLHHRGVFLTERGPLLASSRSIRKSDGSGDARGILITGRFLGKDLEAELEKQTRVDFDFWQLDGSSELDIDARVLDEVTDASVEFVRREPNSETLHVYRTFDDFRGRPEILLRANVRRDITAAGATAMLFGFVSTLAGGLVLLLVLLSLLKAIVIDPVSRLTAHAVQIGKTEDFRAKLDLGRDDEVGTLSREFDNMMEKLEAARAALVDTARAAGMSEIATGILHNVGNVLNSVNVSASTVAQKLASMSLEDLRKFDEILEKEKDDLPAFIRDDPKGKHLQPFLHALTGQLGEEHKAIAGELANLTDGIDHICELIKSQQNYAVKADLVEAIDLGEKLDEALEITDRAIASDGRLVVVREYEPLPEIMLDKHKLAEILVNLIQNARQAMDACEASGQLKLRVERASEDCVRVEVEDTGPGIDPEHLVKIFNLGFTTKKEGQGYGLHTAANAASEMSGKLTAKSEGLGKGATLTLELPFEVVIEAGAVS